MKCWAGNQLIGLDLVLPSQDPSGRPRGLSPGHQGYSVGGGQLWLLPRGFQMV